MSKRVTIVISEENDRAIRKLQSKMIVTTNSGWSFSTIINLVLNSGVKSSNLDKKLKLIEKDYSK